MEKLSAKKKVAIIRLFLSGLSYDEIAAKVGVSKGTVANTVTELKAGVFPEAADLGDQIELLRELSLDLKHSGQSPGQCAVGLAVLNRIKECGLEAGDIDRLSLILKMAGDEKTAGQFVELVCRIHQYQSKSGLSLEQVDNKLHELETKANELKPVLKQLEERKEEVKQLTKRRADLTGLVNKLDDKYALLNPRVQELERRETDLLQRLKGQQDSVDKAQATLAALVKEKEDTIHKVEGAMASLAKEKQRLLKTGFSLETLAEFNDRIRAIAARHHTAQTGMRERLLHELESLDKGLKLEALIQGQEAELKKHQQAIALAKKEQAGLKAANHSLERQKAELEASIKTTREKVSNELAAIIPAARDAINQLGKELHQGNEEVLEGVKHLKSQALEVGKELGRYEGIVKANQWLAALMALVSGEDNIEIERVRPILLLVLRGGESWMKRNRDKTGLLGPLYATQTLIREMEQWRT